MRIIVGHANPDFDAYASMVAATKLFPGSVAVFLGSQNSNVQAFHNLHEEFLSFVDLKGLDLGAVDSVVMVDTRDPDRIGELKSVVEREDVEVIVYDHHPVQVGDIEGADERILEVGATTSMLVHEIRERAIELAPLEASAMLLGIHEDTGSLTYPSSTAYDADAVAYLMGVGADIEVLNQFLSRTLDNAQQALLEQLRDSLETWTINGQQVAIGVARADEYVDSASVLTHYVVEDMGYRVAFAIVSMPERVQIVARSRVSEVDVGAVMARLGGGGHAQAASAGFRRLDVSEGLARVREALALEVRAPMRAGDIMTAPVRTVAPQTPMLDAGELMSRWGHGGLPVIEGGVLQGLVTRKDVDKAVRHGLSHAPVKGFMTRDVVTVTEDVDVADLERLLAGRGIGRLPVMREGALLGIVTRKDVLRAEHGDSYLDRKIEAGHPEATARFLAGIDSALPAQVRDAIASIGAIAQDRDERAHLVGGFVRDMLLGRQNLDVDVVVEGDAVALAEEAAAALGVGLKVHRRFGTAVLTFSKDLHVDVASSRSEYYTKPGALPTVERSSLRQDLLRRDFTINAMAACIDPVCLGNIADPFGGLGDLDSGVVRVLHSLSFVDDPTRILRAARFAVRYGFSLDANSAELAKRAVSMNLLDEVSGARTREELIDILDEDDPATVLAKLHELGALRALIPEAASEVGVISEVGVVEEAVETFAEMAGRHVRRRTALVVALSTSGSRAQTTRWINHYRFGREYAEAALMFASRRSSVMRLLDAPGPVKSSRLYRALSPLPIEALVVLWARGSTRVRDRIETFVRDLWPIRAAVGGADLIAMGYEPSALFASILARALDDRLDGKAIGRDAELDNLKRVAQRVARKT